MGQARYFARRGLVQSWCTIDVWFGEHMRSNICQDIHLHHLCCVKNSLAWGTFIMPVNAEEIISVLCKKRVRLRSQLRRDQFVDSIVQYNRPNQHNELLALLPPRKHWPRPPKSLRKKYSDHDALLFKSLTKYVTQQYDDTSCSYAWKNNLTHFIKNCIARTCRHSSCKVLFAY